MGLPNPKYVTNIEMTQVDCCQCGISFMVPAVWESEKRNSHHGFHCPNGHPLVFQGKSEAQKLRLELEQEKIRREEEFRARNRAENELAKLQRRIKRGVCPLCKRSFENVKRHMACKHPEPK